MINLLVVRAARFFIYKYSFPSDKGLAENVLREGRGAPHVFNITHTNPRAFHLEPLAAFFYLYPPPELRCLP